MIGCLIAPPGTLVFRFQHRYPRYFFVFPFGLERARYARSNEPILDPPPSLEGKSVSQNCHIGGGLSTISARDEYNIEALSLAFGS